VLLSPVDPILAFLSTLPNMLLTIGISIHLLNATYTVYLVLDIDLGLDQYEYNARTGRYELIDEDDDPLEPRTSLLPR
jgi:hypothetical protein